MKTVIVSLIISILTPASVAFAQASCVAGYPNPLGSNCNPIYIQQVDNRDPYTKALEESHARVQQQYQPQQQQQVYVPAQQPQQGHINDLIGNNYSAQVLTIDQQCKRSYGPNAYGSGKYCYCSLGYDWYVDATGSKSCAPAVNTDIVSAGGSIEVAKKSDDQLCKDHYGAYSIWDGRNCSCMDGYKFKGVDQPCVAIPKVTPASQTASVASPSPKFESLLENWQAPATTTPAPTGRRGFWAWLRALFGL